MDLLVETPRESAGEWHIQGIKWEKLGKYDKAMSCYDKAVEIDPEHKKAWLSKGVALGKLGRHEEAISCHEKAIELDPKYKEAWLSKGFGLGELGQHEEAIVCYERVIEIDPKYKEAWFNKGFGLGELGQHEEAIICYDRVIKMDPSYKEAWFNKGFALGELGKHEEAIRCYERVLEIDPGDDYVPSALKLERRANNHQEAENAVSAAREMAQRLKSTGFTSYVLDRSLNIAQSAYENGRYRRAVHYATQCIQEGRRELESAKLEESKNSASRAKKIAPERKEKQEAEAREALAAAKSLIDGVKGFGSYVSEGEDWLSKAEVEFERGNYRDALSYAVEAEKTTRRVKEQSKPEMSIELSQKELEANAWSEIEVSIFNKGTAHAKEVRITFPLHGVVIRGLEGIIPRLNAGEHETIRAGFRPHKEGQIPLDAVISYHDLEGEVYTERESFWLRVEPIREKVPKLDSDT